MSTFLRTETNTSFPALIRSGCSSEGTASTGFTNELLPEWDPDWLVVADQGGDPFILSVRSGKILFAFHGEGRWDPLELFPSLPSMAAALAILGQIRSEAGAEFYDANFLIGPEYVSEAACRLRGLFDSEADVGRVLRRLDWLGR